MSFFSFRRCPPTFLCQNSKFVFIIHSIHSALENTRAKKKESKSEEAEEERTEEKIRPSKFAPRYHHRFLPLLLPPSRSRSPQRLRGPPQHRHARLLHLPRPLQRALLPPEPLGLGPSRLEPLLEGLGALAGRRGSLLGPRREAGEALVDCLVLGELAGEVAELALLFVFVFFGLRVKKRGLRVFFFSKKSFDFFSSSLSPLSLSPSFHLPRRALALGGPIRGWPRGGGGRAPPRFPPLLLLLLLLLLPRRLLRLLRLQRRGRRQQRPRRRSRARSLPLLLRWSSSLPP